MKVTFRCKQSGNCVSFSAEDDVIAMRKEPGYEEIKDGMFKEEVKAPPEEVITPVVAVAVGNVKRGRPRKSAAMEI